MENKSKIEKVLSGMVNVIFIIIVGIMLLFSIFYTSEIKSKEITEYTLDNPIIQIGAIVVFSGIVIFLKNNKLKMLKNVKINKNIIIAIVAIWCIACVMWVFSTGYKPKADQKYVLKIAEQIENKDFSSMEEGGYLYKNPHQLGLVIYFNFFVKVFKNSTNVNIAIQIANIFALLIAFICIYKITKITLNTKRGGKYTLIGLILFIPISFYITFMYGNLTGLACSMIAVLFEVLYLKNEKKRYIIPMAIFASIAVLFKSNYLITTIAMLIILITEMIFRKKLKYIIPIFLILVCYILGGTITKTWIKQISRRELDKGTPMMSYVAMGMQEGHMAEGWYNGYTQKIYKKGKYNQEKTSEIIKNDIKTSVEKFKNDPKYATNFYKNKISSQWNNPTFQSFWIHKNRKSCLKVNKISKKVVRRVLGSGKVNKILLVYMNIVQTLILFGTLMYSIINFKNIRMKNLFFAIIFIGGFLFHIIWEAKAQYTITYFILLIPYAVMGYNKFCEILVKFYAKMVKKVEIK